MAYQSLQEYSSVFYTEIETKILNTDFDQKNILIETQLLVITIQSNLSYPGALGLGGARNSDLSVSQNTILIHRL